MTSWENRVNKFQRVVSGIGTGAFIASFVGVLLAIWFVSWQWLATAVVMFVFAALCVGMNATAEKEKRAREELKS